MPGVTFGKYALELEAERMQSITKSVGLRLKHWLRVNKRVLPDEQFVDIYRYYQASVLAQLREARERNAAAGPNQMTTEQLEAQFQVEVLRAIRTFSPADWEIADRARCERFGAGRWVPNKEER